MNNQCTQVYTVNKPRLSSKNVKIFLSHLTIQFIDLEMLYISVKQGVNFGMFSIFWIRMSRRFLQKLWKLLGLLTKLGSLNYNTEPQNISYIAIEHEAKLSIHQKDEPLKTALYAAETDIYYSVLSGHIRFLSKMFETVWRL